MVSQVAALDSIKITCDFTLCSVQIDDNNRRTFNPRERNIDCFPFKLSKGFVRLLLYALLRLGGPRREGCMA
jgi:hypothetical protein